MKKHRLNLYFILPMIFPISGAATAFISHLLINRPIYYDGLYSLTIFLVGISGLSVLAKLTTIITAIVFCFNKKTKIWQCLINIAVYVPTALLIAAYIGSLD